MIQYAIYQSKANNYTKDKFYARAIHTDIVDLEGTGMKTKCTKSL